MNERVAKLIKDFGGKTYKYCDLPKESQLAIAQYLSFTAGGPWNIPTEVSQAYSRANLYYYDRPTGLNRQYVSRIAEANLIFNRNLPVYVKDYGKEKFGYIEAIPMKVLTDCVMQDEDLQSWDCWQAYHKWYMKIGPKHRATNDHWPVFLSSIAYDTLEDGWTRLHQYSARNLERVPAVYYA